MSGWLGGSEVAIEVLTRAKIDPTLRGEVLVIEDYCAIADAITQMGIGF